MTDNTINRPINGDIETPRKNHRTPQKGAAEFLADLDALLDTEGVEAVAWTQHTPYFNDGDPCEFNTGEYGVILSFGDPDFEDGDFYYRAGVYTSYDLTTTTYGVDANGRRDYHNVVSEVNEVNGHDTTAIVAALNNFSLAAYQDVVQDNFGDPALVVATKDGFEVEGYEHD